MDSRARLATCAGTLLVTMFGHSQDEDSNPSVSQIYPSKFEERTVPSRVKSNDEKLCFIRIYVYNEIETTIDLIHITLRSGQSLRMIFFFRSSLMRNSILIGFVVV